MSELFDSCEKDFQQCLSLLEHQVKHPESYNLTSISHTQTYALFIGNPFEFSEAQKLVIPPSNTHTCLLAQANGSRTDEPHGQRDGQEASQAVQRWIWQGTQGSEEGAEYTGIV